MVKHIKLELDAVVNDGNVEGLKLNDATAAATIGYVNSTGHHTFYFVAAGTAFVINRKGGGATDISIDNVSVKQVDPNNRWVLLSPFKFGDGVVNIDGSQSSNQYAYQNSIAGLIAGRVYKLKFTILNRTAGSFRINLANTLGTFVDADGDYEFIVTATSGTSLQFQASQSFGADITNVSVVEVLGDRPRLSYDITNGVVEDKPHLLLEPSATNLITFSEPTSSETSASNITYEDFSWHLGFTNCIRFVDNSVTRYRYFLGTISNSTEYVISAFVIMDDLSEPVLGTSSTTGDFLFRVGGQSATTGNLPNVNMGNNIYRVSSKITSSSSGGTTGVVKYTGQSNKGFRIVGFQVETTAYATSYIPTAGTTITRAAETCNNSKPSVNSTEGVLYLDFDSSPTKQMIALMCIKKNSDI